MKVDIFDFDLPLVDEFDQCRFRDFAPRLIELGSVDAPDAAIQERFVDEMCLKSVAVVDPDRGDRDRVGCLDRQGEEQEREQREHTDEHGQTRTDTDVARKLMGWGEKTGREPLRMGTDVYGVVRSTRTATG